MPLLEWLTKDEDRKQSYLTPYRLVEPDEHYAYGDKSSGNMLIQGDNLEALKALLPLYAGRVKCVYIDPPYNTETADPEHYDDNLEHSQWLSLMYPRLEMLRELLSEDGSIWVSIDDNEGHYLKVLMDEIFGRANFVNEVSVKAKNTAGASGGGEDKRLKKNVERLLVYVKSYERGFQRFNEVNEETDLFELIEEMEAAGRSWKYTNILVDPGQFIEQRTVLDGSGQEITVRRYGGLTRTNVRQVTTQETAISEREAYVKYFSRIFSDTNAQTSIRSRIIDEFKSLEPDELLIASYIPRSGRDKGRVVEHYYISPSIRRVIWLKDTAELNAKTIIKKDKIGTLWSGFNWNNVTKEGNVRFPKGKKPEALLQTILKLATNTNDLVLDSFLGSGTTAAVAHKMGRRYIGIETGEHAITHCVPRLKAVVDGEQGGISSDAGWQGGGGFMFYRLGSAIFDAFGKICPGIGFAELAAHIWFNETGSVTTETAKTPFLGVHENTACYLLYNGILGDKKPDHGNVLTHKVLAALRRHDGPRLIYGEATLISAKRLKEMNITFKQIPYDIKAR